MKKRILYIILGMMLFANVSFAIADQPIEIVGSLNLSYAGFGRTPAYAVNSAGSLSFLYTDNSTGLIIGANAPKNIGNYKVKITLIDGPDVGFFVETNYTIIKRLISITSVTNTKNYDGTLTASGLPIITTGSLGAGDVAIFKEEYNTKTHGTGKILIPSVVSIVDGSGVDMTSNYTVTPISTTNGIINKKPLSIIEVGLFDKVYDGNTSAVIVSLTSDKLGSDDISYEYSSTFNNKNIGTGKAVAVSGITLTGTDAGNYSLTSATATGTASITVRNLTISATVSDKVYDGNTTATATLTNNKISGDDVTVNQTGATFNNKNIGTGKAVTVSGITLTGADAGNYTLTNATTTSAGTASITVRSLTISATASDKVYDGNTTANVTLTDNKISGDDVTVNQTGATFNNKNIGTGKAVTVSGITLTGADGGNYTLTSATATGTASITIKSLTISATASDKEYDGNTTATATLTDNRITGDVLTVEKTGATFNNKNFGTGKPVTVVGITITGTDAGNYSLTSATVSGTASITVKSLTISATALDKEYDGNTTATATLTDNRISGDDLTVEKTGATFNNKNFGTGKTVTVAGITLTGTDAGNYTITSSTATGTASITVKSLTISATTSDKVYDGNRTATATLIDSRITGDVFTVEKTGATFNNKNIGTGKVVTVSGISLTGTDAGNYTLTSSTATGTASITVRSLTISATASDKVYDGTTTATATLTDNKISGDDLTVEKTGATFNNKNFGTGKTVTVAGITLTGTDAGNYTITSSTATGTASITVKSLTISATTSDKVYDGNRTATATLIDSRITGDVFTVEKTGATFNNKNIGTGKVVTVSGISLTGTDAGNYTLTSSTATGTASITVRSLTISATASDKVYDGTTTATATLTDNKISGDDLTVEKTGAAFNNKNIGSGKTVTVAGITLTGKDAGNYTITSATATGTASITVKSLTISASASDKVYDGNTSANAILTDNRVNGDVLTVNKTGATFNNKNVGSGKAVNLSGITLTGTDAGNYTLTTATATGTASITLKSLTISAIANDKPYDGNKNAIVTLSSNGLIVGDLITLSKTLAEFDNPEVGNNKLVTVSGISIGGVDAGNYSLTNTTATTFASVSRASNTETTKPYDLPNAFTPNGDGKNDEFKIIVNDPSRVTLISFQIYNRNGILMFSTNRISEGWNGRYKDVMQDMGLYFVKLITLEYGLEIPPPIYLLK